MAAKFLKPARLEIGDTVAVVSPASKLGRPEYLKALQGLRDCGLCVVEYPGRRRLDSFFAADDETRANEIDWAFRQPGVKAVFCARGGYGCQRTLRLIEPAQTKKWKPKLLLGYSDVTYFHQFLQNELGWVSVHSPLCGMIHGKALKNFVTRVMNLPDKPVKEVWSEVKPRGLSQVARGRLTGGNLSLIQVDGPGALPREPMILALEDVNENFYTMDRMLQTLLDAGYSRYVKGVIWGTLTGCGKKDSKTFGFWRLIETTKQLTRGPIWTNARFGHGLFAHPKGQRLLPLGCQVEMRGKTLSILEPVVK